MKKKFYIIGLLLIFFSISVVNAKTMIVRVYAKNYQELSRHIDFKYTNIEIAGAKPQEWYELIVESEDYPTVLTSGLKSQVIIEDLELQKAEILSRAQYRSLDSVNLMLRSFVSSAPQICVLESLGLSYENRQIYGVKISDNPSISEPQEPGVFFCGLHHAREWATIEMCLFIIDSILRGYRTVPEIQNLVNNHEIWVFPVINPDGYYYDYPLRRSWRKNRQPFGGSIGTDLNRNYLGACNGDRFGLWGALTSGAQSSHSPSSETFMGQFGASSPEIKALVNFFRTHNINASLSFHSYSELVLWPWGYQNIPTPDNTLYQRVGTQMANMIQKLSGGTYTPQQSPLLYPVSSGSDDWIYGWNKFVNGVPCLAFTNEIGTSFYQALTDVDHIIRQNFKAVVFLTNFSDSVRILMKGYVPPPQINVPDTSTSSNFVVSWKPKNPEFNTPNMWELQELSNYSVFQDQFDTLLPAWQVQGFILSNRRAYSGLRSMYSDSANNISNYIRTTYPYLVNPGDSLTFWCWYNLERNYDVAVAEVSFNTREWFQLGTRMTDTSGGWRRIAYSLEPYVGKSIFIQFRVMTDGSVLKNGFYLDDVYPVPMFNNTRIISSNITDTFYSVAVSQPGHYWYRVRGHNVTNGWGEYSMLDGVEVLSTALAETKKKDYITFNIMPNLFSDNTLIKYSVPYESKVVLKLYDITGRERVQLANHIHKPGMYQINWQRTDNLRKKLPSGIYFLKLNIDEKRFTKRIIVL
ncbi:MAG: M14 family zinc carboxypeptidase [candidate division WOR-3 bacterium]|nr:M14 family zinc carboxypeptidase [candidate division WOR-3 bacterium]